MQRAERVAAGVVLVGVVTAAGVLSFLEARRPAGPLVQADGDGMLLRPGGSFVVERLRRVKFGAHVVDFAPVGTDGVSVRAEAWRPSQPPSDGDAMMIAVAKEGT
jgi:hypothetical protein